MKSIALASALLLAISIGPPCLPGFADDGDQGGGDDSGSDTGGAGSGSGSGSGSGTGAGVGGVPPSAGGIGSSPASGATRAGAPWPDYPQTSDLVDAAGPAKSDDGIFLGDSDTEDDGVFSWSDCPFGEGQPNADLSWVDKCGR